MMYKDLIHFEPITSVIKLVSADDHTVAASLVRTFVFSEKIKEDLRQVILKNLDPNPRSETKGIQIVGSYGTGKSHLMSLVSAIAEDAALLDLLNDASLKQDFLPIAGKYLVLRFEIGNDRPLKDIVFAQIERLLEKKGIAYRFDNGSNFSWKEQIQAMMADFEARFPDKHLLIVIDELLEYLKGRKPTELNYDLMLLRQLGEACDNARFKLLFGVQELLYRSPEFQHQAEMLNKIEDRYADLIITKEDVSFVVKERLLKKDIHQKKLVREHLLRFAHLFEGINTNLNEYVDLFPVHPSFIGFFERIRHGKSQREILKVLSATFQRIMDQEVPETQPGLITYDQYWPELAGNPAMLTFPDIRTIKDKMEIVQERIEGHFTGARSSRKPLAGSIARALAIRILCDDLDKRNGATAHSLKEDLCLTLSGVDDPQLLQDAIESAAKQLVSATAGQYVDLDPVSAEFYIRTEGGINIPQIIRDYAEEVIKRDPETADQYFFDLLQYALELSFDTYRTGFKIWEHNLEWVDKKSFRQGYIFFGNPNERSTTEPVQQYYLFFCPLFGAINRNEAPDELYFDFTRLSPAFRELVCLYGASKAKEGSAPSNQKNLFRQHIEDYRNQALALLDREYIECVQVVYNREIKPLKAFPLPGTGATRAMIFDHVASRLLNRCFSEKFPDYPAFKDLLQPNSKGNFEGRIRSALKKIVQPTQPNRDGEAILAGLGLWNGQSLDTQHSKYADSLLRKLREKGEGKVLNRDEIIYPHYIPQRLWYSLDYQLDHPLELLVLAVLAYKGDLELFWSANKTLSATNIELLNSLSDEDYFTYQYVRQPQGLPIKNLKALFAVLDLPDLSSELEKPETITRIITEAKTRVERVVKTRDTIARGLRCRNVPLLGEEEIQRMKSGLDALAPLLDSIQTYNTYGKLKAFKHTEEELRDKFGAWPWCAQVEQLSERAGRFEKLINYLYTAQSYVVESEKPLYDDMGAAIQQLGAVIQGSQDAAIKQYEARLNALVELYVQYYLDQYAKCRLSQADVRAKERLLHSDEKRICDIVKDAEFITPNEYLKWLDTLTTLKEADPSITKARVKEEPYHDFHPREYYGKPLYKMAELEAQLHAILTTWTQAMRQVFKDPSVQDNLIILKDAERKVAEDFRDGKVDLSTENAAHLRDLISTLSQGIEKVEINLEDLRRQWNRPMTPTEAVQALQDYIDGLCRGKQREKVRIILK